MSYAIIPQPTFDLRFFPPTAFPVFHFWVLFQQHCNKSTIPGTSQPQYRFSFHFISLHIAFQQVPRIGGPTLHILKITTPKSPHPLFSGEGGGEGTMQLPSDEANETDKQTPPTQTDADERRSKRHKEREPRRLDRADYPPLHCTTAHLSNACMHTHRSRSRQSRKEFLWDVAAGGREGGRQEENLFFFFLLLLLLCFNTTSPFLTFFFRLLHRI